MCAEVTREFEGAVDDPRQVLAGWLDAYAANRCERDDLQAAFVSVSRSNAEVPWIALALLDQYQRLGRIDKSLGLSLKKTINQLVFGATKPSAIAAADQPEPARLKPTQPTAVTDESPVATAQNATITVYRNETDVEFHALDHTAPTVIRVDESQHQRNESVNAPARRILRDRYELQELISSDATGKVYKALDLQREHLPLEMRQVAVKIIHLDEVNRAASLADNQQMFYQTQALSHPNIRRVFDLDCDNDTFFAVMELLQGELLSTLLLQLDGRRLARQHALGILSGIGQALIYAYDHGAINGALRPHNVMITHTGEIKVLEFSFTRLPGAEPWISGEASHSTSFDQASHHSSVQPNHEREAQPADDVHNLACIAYELLSGRHPYGGYAGSSAGTKRRRPARIAQLSHRQWQTLQRALQVDHADRRPSISELLTALGCKQRPAPLVSPAVMRAKSTPRSDGLRAMLVTAALLLVVALVAWYAYLHIPLTTSVPQNQAIRQAAVPSIPPAEAVAGIETPATAPSPGIAPVMPTHTDVAPESNAAPVEPSPASSTPATPLVDRSNSSIANETPSVSATIPARESTAAMTSGSVAFAQDTFVASERNGVARVVIRHLGSLTKATQVRWSLIADSAKPGKRYADIGPGVADIPAGVRDYTLLIPLADDAVHQSTELFQVKLDRADAGPPVAQPAMATVAIIDDD
jgi:serine/threonine protein kinase